MAPVFIGNNHIHDISDGVRSTISTLAAQGLRHFGAGLNEVDAGGYVAARSGQQDYLLLGFGWPVIGCVPAQVDSAGVNRLEGRRVRAMCQEAIRAAGGHRVVVVIHGNYEFELYPQPAHRQLAKSLIDCGVYSVIFHHPHIVGPVERYKGRTIAYSVGNWAFSYGRFFGGKLRFPSSSFPQIALELGGAGDVVHHARFQPPSTVLYQSAESVDSSDFSLRPAFEGLNEVDYLQWFRMHRVKRKGLPIYRDSAASLANSFRDGWVGMRQVLIDSAAKVGLKAMRREP
jgi:poly-gamma-glutamate synthesis protein (capsule biosynthesis protein)